MHFHLKAKFVITIIINYLYESCLSISKVLYAISIAWFVLFVWIGTSILLETPTQMAKDKAFIKEEFYPKIAVIEHFKADHHRLPEVSEEEIKLMPSHHKVSLTSAHSR
jgi:hypothetical protein